MSNTPTESEFDKELTAAIGNILKIVYDVSQTRDEVIKVVDASISSIKQANEEQVMQASLRCRIDELEWTTGDVHKGRIDELKKMLEQRKALYGGDKK